MTSPAPRIEFSDGKAPDAMRTIGEVSAALNIRQHVLRYWEDQFPMLRPLKRSGGRRLYRLEDVELVATIDRLVHRDGYTLRGARAAIEGGGAGAGQPVEILAERSAGPAASPSSMLPKLHAIRDNLAAALFTTA